MIEQKPSVDDFVVIVRLKTSQFGIPHIRSNAEAYKVAKRISDTIRYSDGDILDAFAAVHFGGNIHGEIFEVGEFNRGEWE